ncbi:MAG TPA: hypothetical protein VMI92_00180 [Steroidobacteraceae bacterium]|nr:hypothetical protein [Steroidobacteraceae bacterium]
MKRWLARYAGTLVLAAALALPACSSQKLPAEQAIASLQDSLEATRAEAARYDPQKLAAVDQALRSLRTSLAGGDYAGVLAQAPGLSSAIAALAGEVKLKADAVNAALGATWAGLAASVPAALDTVQRRIDTLQQRHALPQDADLKAAIAAWDQAKGAFAAGNMQEAVTVAGAAMSQIQALAARLKVALPVAAAAAP